MSRVAGEPWRDRLLPLPDFLAATRLETGASRADVLAGFALTGFFLERDVFGPRGAKGDRGDRGEPGATGSIIELGEDYDIDVPDLRSLRMREVTIDGVTFVAITRN